MIQAVGTMQVWPVSLVGWIQFAVLILAIVAQFIAWGKFLEKLNGYGVRLTKVEESQIAGRQHKQDLQRVSDRILDQHAAMLERLGEAKRTAEKCDEDTVELGISIGSRIDEMRREINEMNLNLSQRLKSVETVLKIRNG
jgi:biopolymer transport protein ExbB/TolQ